MCVSRGVLILVLFSTDIAHHAAHKTHSHKFSRRHRAINESALRFEPAPPYSKKLELNSSGKIHCKVAGGSAPNVQWFLNDRDNLPEGVTSSNGTLLLPSASPQLAGNYTCRAIDGAQSIEAKITVDVVGM
ncbi:hypothetical protein O0L34_g18845 [Tuta absoluta]|nr:hypothetical protein O0L34_g18845 [Tuta absoluta]